MLVPKHWALWRGDAARALQLDPESALARVALARPDIPACRADAAHCSTPAALLRDAIAAKPAHPYAHLMQGALLRDADQDDAARADFRYETASLEDLQHWSVMEIGPRGVQHLDIGDGLDLGEIDGFYPATDGWRWTQATAQVWLGPGPAPDHLRLRLASGRPANLAPIPVRVLAVGKELAQLTVGPDWQDYDVALPANLGKVVPFTLEAPTFRPRSLDRSNDDNRSLGVKVDWIEVVQRGTS